MAWEWLEKGAKRLQEIGDEYKQHYALVERLLTLDPVAAQLELSRLWPTLDDRGRASMRMTLAGLTLSHQAAAASAAAAERAERLKALHAAVEQASRGTPTAAGASTEATVTSGAARVTQKLADVAERARPKAEELVESARKGIEKHAPKVEAAVKSVVNELLKVQVPGTAPPPANEPPPPAEPATEPPAGDGTATIAGYWVGTLQGASSTDTLGCNLHIAPSGRPIWTYTNTDGFQQREMTHEGQTIEYVPPERGVVRVRVQSVTGSPTETGYVIDYSFEKSSNGYLTQRYQRIVMTGRLHGAQLDVTYSEAGISSFGDKTGLGATEGATEYRGPLTKQG